MSRFAKRIRNQLEEAKRGNDFVHAMYGDLGAPKIEYPEKRKRAAKVVDKMRRQKSFIPSEHMSQATVISWWRLACHGYGLPEFALFSIPNGGARDPITGSRLKAEGVRPGIPDLMLAVKRGDYGGLVIEMKKEPKLPNTTQQEVLAYLESAGYSQWTCWTADAAIATIKHYLMQ